MDRRMFLWATCLVVGLVVLLLAGEALARPPVQGACAPPCWGELACQPVGPDGFKCQETCRCPDGDMPGTPGATVVGTPFVVTPQPSPTPPPGGSVEWCLPDECYPGQTRLWLVWYLYNLGVYSPVRPLEPCCGASCPCGTPTEERQPCSGGGQVACSEWGASVQASLPVWGANRRPYPRALVTVPEEVWVSDGEGNPVQVLPSAEVWGRPVDPGGQDCECRSDGSCEGDPPPAGTICTFRLGLKAEPGNEPPTWSFEGCGAMIGWRAECRWNRSSWGRPESGVGLAPDCPPLPAYAVHASVPYWWSFGRKWVQWEKVSTRWSDCFCRGSEPVGIPHRSCGDLSCGACEGWCGKIGVDIYGWRGHGPGWVLLDLTDYGWPTPYARNFRVQLIPHPPCEPNPPVGVINVPCIEVQAPIEKQPY